MPLTRNYLTIFLLKFPLFTQALILQQCKETSPVSPNKCQEVICLLTTTLIIWPQQQHLLHLKWWNCKGLFQHRISHLLNQASSDQAERQSRSVRHKHGKNHLRSKVNFKPRRKHGNGHSSAKTPKRFKKRRKVGKSKRNRKHFKRKENDRAVTKLKALNFLP